MITSVANAKVKNVMQLNSKAKARREQHSFVVEGAKMFYEAPKDKVKEVYVSSSFFAKKIQEKELAEYNYEVVSDEVFEKMSDTKTPQGILCVVEMFDYHLEDLINKEDGVWIVLEELQDPGNLGTIMRTGEGAGIAGLIMSKNTADIYNPKTIRATMGSIYRIPFVYIADLDLIFDRFAKEKIVSYAAHLSGTQYYDEIEYEKKVAFVIGNEGNGLSEKVADRTDSYLKIPMQGEVESLNAAIATSVLMYETFRQRRKK